MCGRSGGIYAAVQIARYCTENRTCVILMWKHYQKSSGIGTCTGSACAPGCTDT